MNRQWIFLFGLTLLLMFSIFNQMMLSFEMNELNQNIRTQVESRHLASNVNNPKLDSITKTNAHHSIELFDDNSTRTINLEQLKTIVSQVVTESLSNERSNLIERYSEKSRSSENAVTRKNLSPTQQKDVLDSVDLLMEKGFLSTKDVEEIHDAMRHMDKPTLEKTLSRIFQAVNRGELQLDSDLLL